MGGGTGYPLCVHYYLAKTNTSALTNLLEQYKVSNSFEPNCNKYISDTDLSQLQLFILTYEKVMTLIWNQIVEPLTQIWNQIVEPLMPIWNQIVEPVTQIWNQIVEPLTQIWNPIVEPMEPKCGAININLET